MPWIRTTASAPLQITEGGFTFGVQKLTFCDQCSARGYVVIVEGDSSSLGRAHEILQKLGIDVGPLDPALSERETRQPIGPNTHTVHVFYSRTTGLVGAGSCHEHQRSPALGLTLDRDLESRDQLIGTIEPVAGVGVAGIGEDDRAHETSPSVAGCGDPTVGDGQVAGVEHTAPATDITAVEVTPEMIEAVAEFLFDTGVETPMINALRSVAASFRIDLAEAAANEANAGAALKTLVDTGLLPFAAVSTRMRRGRFSNPSAPQ